MCTSLVVLGVHRDGGFSEYAVAPARNAYRIPDNIADHHAVMVEPFTIAANVTGQVNQPNRTWRLSMAQARWD